MQDKETICAIVITYKRRELLRECLNGILRQSKPLDKIIVVDNDSKDGTEEMMQREFDVPQVEYINIRGDNIGPIACFSRAMKKALDEGFDWLWLMDDDLLVSDDSLEILIAKKNALRLSHDRSFILNSIVFSKEKMDNNTLAFPMQELTKKGYPKIGVYHRYLSHIESKLEDGLYQWACPYNGTFIPKQVIEEIGFPNSEFYITGDEKVFFWKVVKNFKAYTAVDSKVFHPEPKNNEFTWKEYYAIRNMFIVNSHLNLTILRNAKLIFKSIVRGFRNGKGGLVLVFHAIKDGLLRNLGRKEGISKWLNM